MRRRAPSGDLRQETANRCRLEFASCAVRAAQRKPDRAYWLAEIDKRLDAFLLVAERADDGYFIP